MRPAASPTSPGRTPAATRSGARASGAAFSWLLGLAVAIPLGLAALSAWHAWDQAWAAARTDILRTADAGAEYAGRVLDAHRGAVDRINDLLRGLSDDEMRAREEELHDALRNFIADTPQLRTAYVLDRNGRLLVSAGAYPVDRDLDMSDREHHTILAAADAPAAAVTRVYRGRQEGDLFFAVARRRPAGGNIGVPPGAFDGQANVAADPAVVGAGLRRLARPGDSVALVREDGEVLALSQGYDREPPIRIAPEGAMLRVMRQGLEQAVVPGPSGVDGAWRLTALRRVAGWPVYVTAGRTRAAIVSEWRRAALGQLAVGLPASALLLGLAVLVQRRRRELAVSHAELERRVAARTAELSAHQARERDVLQSLGEVLYALDASGHLRFASRRALEVWGRREADVLGRPFADVLPAVAGTVAWQVQLDALAARAEVHACVPSVMTDGWLEMDVYPTVDGGMTVAIRDVGDRRRSLLERMRTEAALRESEARFRLVTENAPVMLWMGDENGKCLYLNRPLREFWGVPEAAVASFDWGSTVLPDDREALGREFGHAMRLRIPFRLEARYRRADGQVRTLLTEARPRFGSAGEFLGMIGVNVDVTDARDAEDALVRSERRLRLAQEAGGIGAWELDLVTGARHWSDSNFRLWGMEPVPELTLDAILASIHPEDRARVRAAAESVAGIVGAVPPIEFRIVRVSDRAVRWIRSQAEAVGDEQGRPTRQIGIMRDITVEKEALERLELLMRELDHRAKNALAVVQAPLRLPPRNDPQAVVRAVEGRVAALARAHTLLAEGSWRGADVRSVVDGALRPFLPEAASAAAGPRAELRGPPLLLAPAAVQAISMAMHELATNASKHGALSAAGGCVVVAWDVLPAAESDMGQLVLSWTETGGPPVAGAPTRRGFGSTVVETTMERQLGGCIAVDWRPEGLAWRATLPLPRITAMDVGEAAEAQIR